MKMVIAQISIAPVGKDIDLSEYVKEAIMVIEKYHVPYETNDMSTIIETEDLDTLFSLIKDAHNAVIKKGAKRVITEIKIDDRKDKIVRLGEKSSSITD
jgi:uncharacterized protein (TIGR00106 family)